MSSEFAGLTHLSLFLALHSFCEIVLVVSRCHGNMCNMEGGLANPDQSPQMHAPANAPHPHPIGPGPALPSSPSLSYGLYTYHLYQSPIAMVCIMC